MLLDRGDYRPYREPDFTSSSRIDPSTRISLSRPRWRVTIPRDEIRRSTHSRADIAERARARALRNNFFLLRSSPVETCAETLREARPVTASRIWSTPISRARRSNKTILLRRVIRLSRGTLLFDFHSGYRRAVVALSPDAPV